EDVVMMSYDAAVTEVAPDTATAPQSARSSMSTDADGSRRSTVIFMPGTKATMHFAGAPDQQLSSFHVRATEYTVGANGPEAMPSELPANSGYTHAVD